MAIVQPSSWASVFPPTTLKFDQGLCRVWGGLKVTCTRCQAWYWASVRNLLKCSKATLALAQAVGRTPGVNTHVCLCAQDALLSFPEISVYCLFYAIMINILLSGPTWVDACWKTKSSPGVPNAPVSLASMTGQPQDLNNYRPSITTFSRVKKDQNNTQDTLNWHRLWKSWYWDSTELTSCPENWQPQDTHSAAEGLLLAGSCCKASLVALAPRPSAMLLSVPMPGKFTKRPGYEAVLTASPCLDKLKARPTYTEFWNILSLRVRMCIDIKVLNDRSYCALSMFWAPCTMLKILHPSFTTISKQTFPPLYTRGHGGPEK